MIKTEHDVIRFMKRFPDKILGANEQITAHTWKCSRCETKFYSEISQPIPSPCRMCGGIAFEKID
jgi:DNA-directed RNA polymerase subunit RPC12/RpoP